MVRPGVSTSSRFQAQEAVLDDINTSNTVFTGESVCSKEELSWLRLCTGRLCGNFYWNALLEFNGDVFGLVGRRKYRVRGQLPHIAGRCSIWIFKDAGLIAAVSKVLVHRPGLRFC